MPVDRDFVFKTLRKREPDVYRMYVKCKQGISEREIQNDLPAFYKMHLTLLSIEVLNDLERDDKAEIINDYQNQRIIVKKLCKYENQYVI